MTAIFAPDTNFFLQCKPPDQLNWSLVTQDTSVVLVVVKEVRRELDRHKSGGNERRAKRARRIASQLRNLTVEHREEWVLTPEGAPIRVALARAASLDPNRSKPAVLDLIFADERIVEEALAASLAQFGGKLTLLSHDMVPLESAQEVGLSAMSIPDEWLLDPEPNEQVDELRRLKGRVTALEGLAPNLSIGLEDGLDRIETVLDYFPPLSTAFVSSAMAAIRGRHSSHGPQLGDPRTSVAAAYANMTMAASASQWGRYSSEYAKWLEKVEERLGRFHHFLNYKAAGHRIVWRITNTGASGAERVVVDMDALGDFYFENPEAERAALVKPFSWPPEPPQSSLIEALRNPLAFGNYSPLKHPAFHFPTPVFNRDRHEFYWDYSPKKVPIHCRGQCEDFRHGLQDETIGMVIRMKQPSDRVVEAALRVLVSAGNLPQPMTRHVPVVIRPTIRDTEQAVCERLREDLDVTFSSNRGVEEINR